MSLRCSFCGATATKRGKPFKSVADLMSHYRDGHAGSPAAQKSLAEMRSAAKRLEVAAKRAAIQAAVRLEEERKRLERTRLLMRGVDLQEVVTMLEGLVEGTADESAALDLVARLRARIEAGAVPADEVDKGIARVRQFVDSSVS